MTAPSDTQDSAEPKSGPDPENGAGPRSANRPESGNGKENSAHGALGQGGDYHVLARKYRPQTFSDLVGQDAMVRTLGNAFASGRVAHGFILTGVRGVGKTTTARIIARGLNCVGPDGTGGPTITPCGVCEPCLSIAESRNIDVLEMDAASRTGIDDIREIIESVRYRPAACRFKVYIVDEVHMLSKQAFNGLLKTLEEPPPHVKFIFATTEIRKVPITVLSRCQRFDLRRIEPPALISHLTKVLDAEGASGEDGALALIARAAEGSARDAMSLLDQALAHGTGGETGAKAHLRADDIRDMLGLADRGRVIDLFDMIMAGKVPEALAELHGQYDSGADPVMVLNDLLEVTHWLTRINVVPGGDPDPSQSPAEWERGVALAGTLPVHVLTRAWQILLKGLSEVQNAPNAIAAAEMVLIRLGYASTLKTPDDLLRSLGQGGMPPAPGGQPASPSPAQAPPQQAGAGSAGAQGSSAQGQSAPVPSARGHSAQEHSAQGHSAPGTSSQGGHAARSSGQVSAHNANAVRADAPSPMPQTEPPQPQTHEHRTQAEPAAQRSEPVPFEDLVALAHEHREIRLETEMRQFVHVVRCTPGRLDFRPADGAPEDLASRLSQNLSQWTGQRWVISVSNEKGAPTFAEIDRKKANEERAALLANPLVAAALEHFPTAQLGQVRKLIPDLDDPSTGGGSGGDLGESPAMLESGLDDDDDF